MEFMLLVALCQTVNPVNDDCIIIHKREVKSQSEAICDEAARFFAMNFVPNITYPVVMAACVDKAQGS